MFFGIALAVGRNEGPALLVESRDGFTLWTYILEDCI